MGQSLRCLFRTFLGLLLFLPAALPLQAQLDPRLQSSVTDFLDMYQQSSSVQAKPEILTMFDFSRSMASLMFHPLYQNNDTQDADDYRYMSFTVTPAGSGGAASNNSYTITATDGTCAAATATYKFTVNANGTCTVNTQTNAAEGCLTTTTTTASSYTLKASAAGNTNANVSVTAVPVSATTANTSYILTIGAPTASQAGSVGPPAQNSYTMGAVTVTANGVNYTGTGTQVTLTKGTVVTFKVILTHLMIEGETSGDDGITYSGGPSGGTLTAVSGQPGEYTESATWTVPTFTPVTTTADPTQLSTIQLINSTTLAAGNTIDLACYYLTKGTSSTIKWSESGSNNCTAVHPIPSLSAASTTGTTSLATTGYITWVVPPYCATTSGATAATITAAYSPVAGVNPVPGVTYLTSNLSFVALIKPNGNWVTATDAAGPFASGPPWMPPGSAGNLYGTAFGANDARNWIRCASHVRFAYAFAKNALPNGANAAFTRTIDIPLPWKIIDPAATPANPLASLRTLDLETKPSGTTYGSNTMIEMDGCYGIEGSNGAMFCTNNSGTPSPNTQQTTVYLYDVVYRPAYISWLFNGQYQSTNPTGMNYTTDTTHLAIAGYSTAVPANLVVFDTSVQGLSPGQSTVADLAWGQDYGPSGTAWGNIYVPQYSTTGTYTGTIMQDASGNQIPTLTRQQAVKRAAIQTWIAHQADVYWAFRYLDVTDEAVNGTASTIDNNSNSHWANPVADKFPLPAYATYPYPALNGYDSGWAVLNNTATQGTTSTTGNSVIGMERIANMFAYGSTPLTYAMARSLAQFTDPNSVFNSVEGSSVSQCANSFLILFTDGVDNNGLPADSEINLNTYTPYITGTGNATVFNALAGNQTLITNPTWVNPSFPLTSASTNNCWNLYTYAAIAAHLGDASFGLPNVNYLPALNPPPANTSLAPSGYLPLAISQRNGVIYSSPHLITTMTVGVSLGGYYNQTGSPKQSLFLAALCGDPTIKGSASTTVYTATAPTLPFHPFVPPVYTYNGNGTINTVVAENDWVPSNTDPSAYPSFGTKQSSAVYYFDGTNPATLSQGLGLAVALALGTTSNNATSNPNLPYVGATFGQEVYIGKFVPPTTGGVIWLGDLLMFGTQDTNGTFTILDTGGNPTSDLTQATAQWSASTALLNNRLWSARNLFTRLPGNATNPELGLHAFSDIGTVYTNASTTDNTAGLKNFVAIDNLGAGSPLQEAVIQNAAGGNTLGTLDGTNRPTANRINIMGDIIDSNPAQLQYNIGDSSIQTGITAHAALNLANGTTFRLILAGTNQGWLHAFGEVSALTNVPNAAGQTVQIVKANVDELWAFMPTDFLKNLDYVYGASSSANPHRFMVDGTPAIYFLDLPNNGAAPNGILDYGTGAGAERGVVIIGLGKGGRSYYALDIHDPFNPKLLWSLVPDEAAFFPATRNLSTMTTANLQTLIGNMGFSTCTPGIGRVLFTSGGVQTVHDVVFLGGGLSVPQIEYNFPIYPPPGGQQTFLGRSVLALDAYTGQVLAAYGLPSPGNSSTAGPGPVVAGVVPTEVILNSGMAQRAYFLDRNGGLWAWGSKGVVPTSSPLYPTYANFRFDSSDLAAWTVDGAVGSAAGVRKVSQDGTGLSSIYTTLPAPFVVSSFPGANKTAGLPAPSAVGIAMESGDRYNPMDGTYFLGTPTNFRLTVAFDRQDSRAWGFDTPNGPDTGIQDANLSNFTSNIFSASNSLSCTDSIGQYITAGCSSYYLDPTGSGTAHFGYYVNFPGVTNGFLPKGITPPEVVSNSLFYSYFTPSSYDPCMGGAGTTYTNLINDVMNPIVVDHRANIAAPSGNVGIWSGVASSMIAFGTRGVIQGGTVAVSNPAPGAPTTTPIMSTFLGQNPSHYPKARVWRNVPPITSN